MIGWDEFHLTSFKSELGFIGLKDDRIVIIMLII